MRKELMMNTLELKCKLEELVTEREGMIAENKQREHLGQSMAYVETDFDSIRTKFQSIKEKCLDAERIEKIILYSNAGLSMHDIDGSKKEKIKELASAIVAEVKEEK